MIKKLDIKFLIVVMMLLISFLFVNLAITNPVINIEIDWKKTFGGPNYDEVFSLIQTTDGGYALGGGTESYGAEGTDFWLIKTDAYGQVLWNRTFGGENYDFARDCIQTPDGGYVIAGESFGWNKSLEEAFDEQTWIFKTNSTGFQEWNYTIEDSVTRPSIVQTADDGFALIASIKQLEKPSIVKIDANGNHEWNYTFEVDFSINTIIQSIDGGFAVSGLVGEYPNTDFLLLKRNATGGPEWNKTYSRTNFDEPNLLFQLADGSYFIIGSSGIDVLDVTWVLKTDANGEAIWNATISGKYDSGCLTADGGFFFAGDTHSMYGDNDIWCVKMDNNTQIEWEKRFETDSKDQINAYYGAVIQASDGQFVVAGITETLGTDESDILLFKTKIGEDTTTTSQTTNETTPENTPSWTFLFIPVALIMLLFVKKREGI